MALDPRGAPKRTTKKTTKKPRERTPVSRGKPAERAPRERGQGQPRERTPQSRGRRGPSSQKFDPGPSRTETPDAGPVPGQSHDRPRRGRGPRLEPERRRTIRHTKHEPTTQKARKQSTTRSRFDPGRRKGNAPRTTERTSGLATPPEQRSDPRAKAFKATGRGAPSTTERRRTSTRRAQTEVGGPSPGVTTRSQPSKKFKGHEMTDDEYFDTFVKSLSAHDRRNRELLDDLREIIYGKRYGRARGKKPRNRKRVTHSRSHTTRPRT